MDHGLSHRFSTTTALAKWLIFGVLLPLLPIGSKVMAQWINDVPVDLTPIGLFGDGELLVIATVIAAAGIGDLVFDLRKRQQGELKDAAAVSLALICVIVSVLLYGFVTVKKQTTAPAQRVAALVVQEQQSALVDAHREIALAEAETTTAKHLLDEQRKVDPTGKQPLSLALQDRLVATTSLLSRLQGQLPTLLNRLSEAQQSAAEAKTVVSENTTQAAIASLIMFIASFISGAFCISIDARSNTAKSRRTPKNPMALQVDPV